MGGMALGERRALDKWRTASAAIVAAVALAATGPAGRPTTGQGVASAVGRTVSVLVAAVTPGDARAAVERHGGEVTGELALVDAVVADVPADAVAAVAGERGVRSVGRNDPVHVQGGADKGTKGTKAKAVEPAAYLQSVGADEAWKRGVDGAGVRVALVDTGVSPVGDLAGRVVGGVDLSGEGDPTKDGFGHGTFVAGMIAGSGMSSAGGYRGVAPAADVVPVKIAGADGSSTVARLLDGIQWVVQHRAEYGIRVLNLSVGTDSAQPYRQSILDLAVERAWDAGLVVVVSASNRGPGAGTISKPADDPLVLTVGASDDAGTVTRADDVVAPFSGRGPTAADGLAKPDLVAPGAHVVGLRVPGSLVDTGFPDARVGETGFRGSGTSFAAGMVSGAAALLLQQDPAQTPDMVKARLVASASASGADGLDDPMAAGGGQLDVRKALTEKSRRDQRSQVRSAGDGSMAADAGSTPLDTPAGWDASQWYASQWYASQWYASQWYASQWYASQWYASQWG